MARKLAPIVRSAGVVVCVGTGGVGKTSTAAAIALHGARAGRRTAVITIDPARRLADALGVGELANEPQLVAEFSDGQLFALMLDTKGTFDALVSRYAKDATQRQRILDNPLYQNIAGALSGTQDYMAIEKLYELHESGEFDLIVVDTPPTHHALAFLDAPRLLTRLLENRVYRLLMAPRGLVRAVNTAAQLVVRQLTRAVGVAVVDDAIAFFRAFEGMEAGFTARAHAVTTLLQSDRTAFVLVATPREDTIREANAFVAQLAGGGIGVRACIVNRMTPRFPAVRERAATQLPQGRALAQLREAAAAEGALVGSLVERVGPVAVVKVDLFDHDLHDLAGIAQLEGVLFK